MNDTPRDYAYGFAVPMPGPDPMVVVCDKCKKVVRRSVGPMMCDGKAVGQWVEVEEHKCE